MPDEPNEWRETVRDLYDKLHFGPDNIFTGNRLAMGIVAFIEERHPEFFGRHLGANGNRVADHVR